MGWSPNDGLLATLRFGVDGQELGVTSPFAQNRTLTGFRMVLAFQHDSESGLCNEDWREVPCWLVFFRNRTFVQVFDRFGFSA